MKCECGRTVRGAIAEASTGCECEVRVCSASLGAESEERPCAPKWLLAREARSLPHRHTQATPKVKPGAKARAKTGPAAPAASHFP
eukprot:56323-Pyramimonas_sp.AAC.1